MARQVPGAPPVGVSGTWPVGADVDQRRPVPVSGAAVDYWLVRASTVAVRLSWLR